MIPCAETFIADQIYQLLLLDDLRAKGCRQSALPRLKRFTEVREQQAVIPRLEKQSSSSPFVQMRNSPMPRATISSRKTSRASFETSHAIARINPCGGTARDARLSSTTLRSLLGGSGPP